MERVTGNVSLNKIELLIKYRWQLRWPSGKSVCLGSCTLGFDSKPGQTNDFKINIHSFPAWRAGKFTCCAVGKKHLAGFPYLGVVDRSELPVKNGEKPEKVGGQKVTTGGLCREQWGVGAEPPATENFCILYLKTVIFSAFNCITCCNNVLSTMHYTNTKCSGMWQSLSSGALRIWQRGGGLQRGSGTVPPCVRLWSLCRHLAKPIISTFALFEKFKF